jgi:hypothetical protein
VALTEAERRRLGGGVWCADDGRRGSDGSWCTPTHCQAARLRLEHDRGGSWGGIEIGEERERGDPDAWGPSTVPSWFKPIQRF